MTDPVISLKAVSERIVALGLKPVIRKTFSAAQCLYDAVHGRDHEDRDCVVIPALEDGYDARALDAYLALRPAA